MDPNHDESEPTRQAGGPYRLLIFGVMLLLGVVAIVLLALNSVG